MLLQFADEVLSAHERARSAKLQQTSASEAYRCGRGLLRLLLGSTLEVPPGSVNIMLSETGKPHLGSAAKVYFNLSHTSRRLLLAMARENEIGVDIEERALSAVNEEEVQELAELHFRPEEVRLLATAPSCEMRMDLFLKVWTAREAVAKASGIGITEPWRLQLDPSLSHSGSFDRSSWNVQRADGQRLQYFVRSIGDTKNQVAALASSKPEFLVQSFGADSIFDVLSR